MARPLRPWVLKNKDAPKIKLHGPGLELHNHLIRWDALFLEEALAVVDANTLYLLTRRGETYIHPTPFGETVILGPEGRLRAGKNPYKRPPTDRALNYAYLARGIRDLQDQGYRYVKRENHTQHWVIGPDWVRYLLVGHARGVSSRTIRRLMKRYHIRMLMRRQRLLVMVPDLRTIRHSQAKNRTLLMVYRLPIAQNATSQFMLEQEAVRRDRKRELDRASWHRRK